jgi:predicted transcriptional regulator
MAVQIRTKPLDFSDDAPDSARAEIKKILAQEPAATRKVYAALAHKVWTLLVERQLGSELRDWHVLLQALRSHFALYDQAAAERMVALSDLVRQSIHLAETSPAADLAKRTHAKRILHSLGTRDGPVLRQELLDALKIKGQHLSNILTQLIANDLIRRETRGKAAAFSLTKLGQEIVGKEYPPQLPLVDMTALLRHAHAIPDPHIDQAWIIGSFSQAASISLFDNHQAPKAGNNWRQCPRSARGLATLDISSGPSTIGFKRRNPVLIHAGDN